MTVAEHLGKMLACAADLAEMRPNRSREENLLEIRESAHKLGFNHDDIEKAIQILSDDSL